MLKLRVDYDGRTIVPGDIQHDEKEMHVLSA